MIIETTNTRETRALGEFLGSQARPGQIYTMVGDLGVGKTVFTQGVRPGAWNPGSGKQPDLYDRPGI